jgi:hypothetical protein
MPAFDPLSYENLGLSISRALDDQPLIPLEDVRTFDGVGIYALYYTGNFPAYRILAEHNINKPGCWAIYVGKAEAESARKGDPNQASIVDGPKLFNRIMQHKRSIECAVNLKTEDFSIRYLTVAPTWVSLAEVIALRIHKPLWNAVVDGLGNHDPGAGRRKSMRPRWDTVHPGRAWAAGLVERNETAEEIMQDAMTFLRQRTP